MKQSKMEREIGRTKKIYESMEMPKALDDVVRGALKQETWEHFSVLSHIILSDRT